MTWFIIAPDHKVATAWMKITHPDVAPYSNDIKIVTPANADKLRGVRFHDGDRLIRINDDWLPNTPGTRSMNDNIRYVLAGSSANIKTEWVEW